MSAKPTSRSVIACAIAFQLACNTAASSTAVRTETGRDAWPAATAIDSGVDTEGAPRNGALAGAFG